MRRMGRHRPPGSTSARHNQLQMPPTAGKSAAPTRHHQFATYTAIRFPIRSPNRYYKPEWGRFTSPDPYQASGSPADPGSWNRYAYVGGDPVNFNDPLGLDAWVVPFGESMPLFPRKPPGSGGVGGGGGEGGKDKYAPDEGSEDWHAELAASTAAMWMAELLKEAVSAAVSLIRTKDSCRSFSQIRIVSIHILTATLRHCSKH